MKKVWLQALSSKNKQQGTLVNSSVAGSCAAPELQMHPGIARAGCSRPSEASGLLGTRPLLITRFGFCGLGYDFMVRAILLR